ncbi:MAG TPA: peptidoglycan editing factor PgeF [Syntrophomonadaceae bacterium]|nr:peptidoglycan editing factor PgeF [Syntrophomonadaceae bacterium]
MLRDQKGIRCLDLPGWEKRGVKAFYSTREGGGSQSPYGELNLALHIGDEPDRVLENRYRLLSSRGVDLQDLICCEQVHGARVATVGKSDAGRGALDHTLAVPSCDALITSTIGVCLGAFFADCFSIFLFDPRRRAIGLAHAGWKGTMNHIAGRTFQAMKQKFSCHPQDLEVFIGPGISSCCFEIQPDLVRQVESSFGPTADLIYESGGRYTWDLAATNAAILTGMGVDPDHIEICGLCTSCRDDLFYSYRRDQGKSGRMGAFISLQY